MIFTILTIWILFSIIEGKREAHFWHHRNASPDYGVFAEKDRHPLFMFQRGLVLLIGAIASFYITESIWWSLFIMVMNMLVFSFFHNGMMYTERYNMSKMVSKEPIYPKKWFDQSLTSQAKLTKFMTPISRTIQALLGIGGYIVYIILQ